MPKCDFNKVALQLRLQKYCTIILTLKMKNVYVNILCCSVFSYRSKVIIKGVSYIIGIGNSITIIKSTVGELESTILK